MSWYMCPVISRARPSPGDGRGISSPSDHLEISRSVRPSGSSSPDIAEDIADAKGSSRGVPARMRLASLLTSHTSMPAGHA
jgi:hypothetical protein